MNKLRTNTILNVSANLSIIFSLLFLSSFQSNAANTELSWRDINLGLTTETEIWKNLGDPSAVIIFPKDYRRVKKSEQPNEVIFRYHYTILNIKDDILFLKRTPLPISDEIISIDANFVFINSVIKSYNIRYTFMPNKTISRKKYVEIFSQMLGEPIKYNEQMKISSYFFKNHFSLSFLPDRLSNFTMELPCHPNN